MYTSVHDSGDMLKFIRQKRGAECEHSEEFGEVDKRHKLALPTWSDNVNLKSHHDGVSHCPYGNPSPCDWAGPLRQLRKVQTWWGGPVSRLPKGSFVVPMSLTRTRPSLQNVAQPATTMAAAVPLFPVSPFPLTGP